MLGGRWKKLRWRDSEAWLLAFYAQYLVDVGQGAVLTLHCSPLVQTQQG